MDSPLTDHIKANSNRTVTCYLDSEYNQTTNLGKWHTVFHSKTNKTHEFIVSGFIHIRTQGNLCCIA